MVFFYHWLFDEPNSWQILPRALVREGYLGVAIFFALSGYLITTRYYYDLDERRISYGRYLLKRFARVYPLYFFVMTFMVVAFGRPVGQAPGDVWTGITNYTLTQALFPSLLLTGTATGWTLTIEEMFYLVAPALMAWLAPGDRPTVTSDTPLNLRRMLLRAGLVTGVALASVVILAALPPFISNTLIGAKDTYLLQYSIFGRIPDLLSGMLIGFVFLHRNRFPILIQHAQKLIWGGAIAMLCGMLLTYLAARELGTPANRALGFSVALSCSVFILGMSLDNDCKNLITRLMGSRLMVYLGKLSYGLYLIQLTEPCQWAYWILLGSIQSRVPHAMALYAIATLMCAALYEFVEKPAQRLLTGRLQPARPKAIQA